MLREGVVLGQRYEIISCIGSGGMAFVYKGRDHKLNRLVAIKVLKSDYRADQVFVKKFLSEAQAAAGLMHPNVVNVYDVGQDRGLYYMVMELVEGITLKDYIQRKGRLSAKETVSISIQMLTGIQAAHNKHIAHRDIKPQNIIVSKDGKVKVTDFGIARATTSTQTVSSSVMGSVHYTSPEHARGDVVDEQSDIYSAGITMYEMVTGEVPFDGDSTVTVALKHLQEKMPSPAEVVPDIPYSLECIILKCTDKNPKYRYADCQALINDLKRSIVDPEGSFVLTGVASAPKKAQGNSTVLMSTDELKRIQNRRYDNNDDYEDEDDDDYEDDYEDYDDEPRGKLDPNAKRIMKVLGVVTVVVLALALIFFVARGAGLFDGFGSAVVEDEETEQVEVPDVVGMTIDEARQALNEVGLGLNQITREASDDVEEGLIMEQDVEAGDMVDVNSPVNVVVSAGPEVVMIEVPDVVGLSEQVAEQRLRDAGFEVTRREEFDDEVAEGDVISTNPVAGTEVAEGSSVSIVVSRGPEEVAVPDLRNITRNEAENRLTDADLRLGNVTEAYSDTVAVGMVISQSVAAGQRVASNTSVNIVISRGPETRTAAVPNLQGVTRNEAENRLRGVELTLGSVSEQYSDTVSAGMVISQSVAAGQTVDVGTSVNIVISRGQQVQMTTVPSLLGMSESDARVALSAVGLSVGTISNEHNTTVTAGSVISQTHNVGSEVPRGTAVGFVISLGPE